MRSDAASLTNQDVEESLGLPCRPVTRPLPTHTHTHAHVFHLQVALRVTCSVRALVSLSLLRTGDVPRLIAAPIESHLPNPPSGTQSPPPCRNRVLRCKKKSVGGRRLAEVPVAQPSSDVLRLLLDWAVKSWKNTHALFCTPQHKSWALHLWDFNSEASHIHLAKLHTTCVFDDHSISQVTGFFQLRDSIEVMMQVTHKWQKEMTEPPQKATSSLTCCQRD